MPTVPTYDSPKVAPRPVSGVKQSGASNAQAFGSSTAQALQGFGQGVANDVGGVADRVARDIQDRENADTVRRAFVEFDTQLRGYLHDPDTGLYARRGVNAKGATLEATKRLDELEAQVARNLANDAQRDAFSKLVFGVKDGTLNGAARHEAREFERSANESRLALIKSAQDSAASNYTDPRQVARYRDTMLASLDTMRRAQGWDESTFNQVRLQYETEFHKGVVLRMVEDNAAAARAYFEANKDTIAGSQHAAILAKLEHQGVLDESQQASDALYLTSANEKEALAEARKRYTGKVRDAVVVRLTRRYAEDRALQDRDLEERTTSAFNAIMFDGAGIEAIPQDAKPRDREAMLSYLRGDKRKTDYEVLDAAEQALEQGDVSNEQQLARFRPYLSERDYRTLKKTWEKRGEIPYTELKRAFIDRLGKNQAKWSAGNREEWLAFQDYIAGRVKEVRRPEDLDVWADRWFMEGRTGSFLGFGTGPDTFGEAVREGKRGAFLFDVPEENAVDVREAVRLSGLDLNAVENRETAVREFYTKQYLPAVDYFGSRGIDLSPRNVAAYSLLQANGKPITPANIAHIADQLEN